ncbi:HAL/PAL/TAL family ammonia-lyase [Natronospira bacteriovora]|uniref:Aromatic amino acid ammonia-lyase n=1 Tax=Natronospira bacteriovora TaxID=3069753 RepID=A0ABU0W7U1_9GAMM|nr:aromatic amino acid ammonia-lyase [Natronospira sp. AB-CW4]MDQ2069989.1 aromatic amino acid ammonia-lyase [Natronospira sp. AB-CW4]
MNQRLDPVPGQVSSGGVLEIGGRDLAVASLDAVARRRVSVSLSADEGFRDRIRQGAARVSEIIASGRQVYGISTGFGDSCTVSIPADQLHVLPLNLTRYHGCGMGEYLSDEAVRATMLARVNSLARGVSGVRLELLENLVRLLQEDVLPMMPAEGSVGASGDLTPLSYLAATLLGEREVRHQGRRRPAAEVLAEIGIEPLQLKPKEGLALMNGTAVMTGIAGIVWARARQLVHAANRITAMASTAMAGNADHFHPELFAMKPHPGQSRSAAAIRQVLPEHTGVPGVRLQDRYSIRCAPHVIGVLDDTLDWTERWLDIEFNSANDNPLIDPVDGSVYHGGHFYGGHVGQAMDSLKTAIASLADLQDRQMAQLVDARFSNGLPANLASEDNPERDSSHGLKALQISVSAWTAEALKLTMPATAFSRSTECHNQDKVSMGTIAARDALRVLELAEQVCTALLVTVSQALYIREQRNELRGLPATVEATLEAVRQVCPPVHQDRALEMELRALLDTLRDRRIPLENEQ